MSNPYVKDITFDKLNEGLVSSKAVFNEDNKLNVLPYALNKDNNSQVRAIQSNANSQLEVAINGDDSGTSRGVRVDGNGNLMTQVINSLNILPANTLNGGITDDPANSVSVSLRGRTDKDLSSSETHLLCDTQGHLQVDVLNQNQSAQLEGFTDINDVSSVKRVLVDADGHLQVDVLSGGGGGGSSNLTYYTATIINSGSIGAGSNVVGVQDLTTSIQKVPDDIWITATNSTLGSLDCSIEFSTNGTDYFEPATMTPYNIFTSVASFKATEITLGGGGSGGDRLDPPRYIRYKLTNNSASPLTASLVVNYWG